MASVNLSRLKHHECAKCGSAILALPRKDLACEQCGCTLLRVRRPTEEEQDYFVAQYIKEEERERASEERKRISENRIAVVALAISGVAVTGFVAWAWDKPLVWLLVILGFFTFGVFASIFR